MNRQSDGIAFAPWTTEQVASLNAYQAAGVFHPFTCGISACRAEDHLKRQPLIAFTDGWHCLRCEYTQDWAHVWMADGSWRQLGMEHATVTPS
jgi:hypothetical protein